MSNNGRRGVPWVLLLAVAALAVVGGLRAMRGGVAPVPAVFVGAVPLADAQAQSASSGKPVLVFATADWCVPCQRLKRGALSDPELAARIEAKTIAVYLDVTDGVPPEAAGLGIEGIPALIVLKDGRVVSRSVGLRSAAELKAWLDSL